MFRFELTKEEDKTYQVEIFSTQTGNLRALCRGFKNKNSALAWVEQEYETQKAISEIEAS